MHTDIYALVHAVAAPPPPYQQRQLRTRTLKDLRPNENKTDTDLRTSGWTYLLRNERKYKLLVRQLD